MTKHWSSDRDNSVVISSLETHCLPRKTLSSLLNSLCTPEHILIDSEEEALILEYYWFLSVCCAKSLNCERYFIDEEAKPRALPLSRLAWRLRLGLQL